MTSPDEGPPEGYVRFRHPDGRCEDVPVTVTGSCVTHVRYYVDTAAERPGGPTSFRVPSFWDLAAEGRPEVPDEITDAVRARWACAIDFEPIHQDLDYETAGALSSDELLDAIGEAVDEWRDIRG